MYTTASFSGVTLSAAVVPGENAEEGQDSLADWPLISIKYTHRPFSVSISHDNDIDFQNTTRFVVETKLAEIDIGLLWQTAEIDDGLPMKIWR